MNDVTVRCGKCGTKVGVVRGDVLSPVSITPRGRARTAREGHDRRDHPEVMLPGQASRFPTGANDDAVPLVGDIDVFAFIACPSRDCGVRIGLSDIQGRVARARRWPPQASVKVGPWT